MNVHLKENPHYPEYPEMSAQTAENIFGNAHRDYRQKLGINNDYTYK